MLWERGQGAFGTFRPRLSRTAVARWAASMSRIVARCSRADLGEPRHGVNFSAVYDYESPRVLGRLCILMGMGQCCDAKHQGCRAAK